MTSTELIAYFKKNESDNWKNYKSDYKAVEYDVCYIVETKQDSKWNVAKDIDCLGDYHHCPYFNDVDDARKWMNGLRKNIYSHIPVRIVKLTKEVVE